MNPFDLSDSMFFFAYLALIVAVVFVVRWLRRSQEQTSTPTMSPDLDPHSIAMLRAGVSGAAQLALANATQRGSLVHEGFKVRAVPGAASPYVVEQTMIDALQTPRTVTEVFRLPALMTLLDGYQRQLETQGLLPDAARREQRQMLWRGGVGVLWLVAGVRIATKLSHAEPVAFDVVMLAFVALPFVRMAAITRRTLAGDRVLADLTQRVRQQLPSLSSTEPWGPDQLLAGAVLGMSSMEIARRMQQGNSTDSSYDSSYSSSSSGDDNIGDSRDGDSSTDGESSSGGESSCGGDSGGD